MFNQLFNFNLVIIYTADFIGLRIKWFGLSVICPPKLAIATPFSNHTSHFI